MAKPDESLLRQYGSMDYTEEGDERLAEIYRHMHVEKDGLYHVTVCERCGYDPESFACKIRHLQINSGTAKASHT